MRVMRVAHALIEIGPENFLIQSHIMKDNY